MEKITISGQEFQFEINEEYGEYGTYHETNFYQGTETKTYRKYWLFGPKITVVRPKLAFTFSGSIKSNSFTKKSLREQLEKHVELLNRQAEIDRGEII